MMQTSHLEVVKSVVSYFSKSEFADFFVDVEREIQMESPSCRRYITTRKMVIHL